MRIFTHILVFLSLLLISCKNTGDAVSRLFLGDSPTEKKVDADTIDRYPTFPVCRHLHSVSLQKRCFEQTISSLFKQLLSQEVFSVKEPISDTIWIIGNIDTLGKISFEKSICSKKTRVLLPHLDTLIQKEIHQFPQLDPAQKKGVSTQIQFQIPLVVHTN